MAEVLQLSQLVQHDRVAQVDVGRGWIEAKLATQWLTGRPRPRQLLRKLGLHQEFVATTLHQRERVLDFPSNGVGLCRAWIHGF